MLPLAAAESNASGYCPSQPGGRCPGRASPSNHVTITKTETLTEEARDACVRVFGATTVLRRIDRGARYIYCAFSNNDSDSRRIKYSFGSSTPTKPSAQTPPATIPPVTEEPNSTAGNGVCPDQPGGVCASTPPAPPDYTPQVLIPPAAAGTGHIPEAARQFCVSKYGPSSTVNHIDYDKWEVVCNIP